MLSIKEYVNEVISGRRQAVAAVGEYLDKIKASQLNSFITVTEEIAFSQAQALDKKISQGESVGCLAGVPVAIKDIILAQGIRSTGGSKILSNYVAPYDATVVERLKNEGAIIVGKTNCDEFAMGSSGENSGYGPTKNPIDTSRVPGGSSSGSAAAVAAQECLASLGTDTGGSIRQPAAFCGVVGLKPTYGRVSRYGLMAMTSSLDQAGPICKSVADAAEILKVIAGYDSKDATSSTEPVDDYTASLENDISGLKVGLAKEFFGDGLDQEVKKIVEQAVAKLESLGAKVVQLSLPTMAYALAAYYVICPSEVSANMSRYDGVRYGVRENTTNLFELYTATRGKLLGSEVKRRIMLGTYALSAGYYDAYYRQAQLARQVIKADFAKAFSEVDILATPTTPTPAFKLNSKITDPLSMYMADVYTVPVNIAGLPAISLPCGLTKENLPVGLQLIGNVWSEAKILQLAYHYEQSQLK